MIKNKQKGVSLLEVVIVMAISAMMIAVVFQWLSVRKRTQFTTDMNTLLSQVKGVQTAVLANEGPKKEGAPPLPCTQILPTDEIVGQAVYFSKQNPRKYQIYKLRSPSANPNVTCYEVSNIDLPSSVGYDNTSDNNNPDEAFITFVRSTNQAYYWDKNCMSVSCSGRNSPGLTDSDFSEVNQNNGQPVILNFQDLNDANFKAKLKFDLKNNKVDLNYQ